ELKRTGIVPEPPLLPELTSLNVTVYGCRKPPFIDTIYYVYETLAASSKLLETLRIKIWYSERIHEYEGGKMANDMILSLESLSHLCLKCPNLETLGFSVAKRSNMVAISTALNLSNRLCRLRLTMSRERSARTSFEFFHLIKQYLSQLVYLHVRSYKEGRFISQLEYTLWKMFKMTGSKPSSWDANL
ncbi:2982_t:CDS:2, partial [Acaulospora colombiana]